MRQDRNKNPDNKEFYLASATDSHVPAFMRTLCANYFRTCWDLSNATDRNAKNDVEWQWERVRRLRELLKNFAARNPQSFIDHEKPAFYLIIPKTQVRA